MISNEIGRVVAVHGYMVKVELEAGQRSPVRTTLEGTDTPILGHRVPYHPPRLVLHGGNE